MRALPGVACVAAVFLLTEMATVSSIPQHLVNNRIVNRPLNGLLVPNPQSQVPNVGQSQHPGFQQLPGDLAAAQGQQNARIPQVQVNQNLPDNNRPPRLPQQDSFFPQGAASTPSQSQPNIGGPQSSVFPGARRKHSSCGKFPSPGQCQAAFPRYYYNASMSQCECYLFGGCDEGEGSYKTLEDCHMNCLPERKEEGPSCRHIYVENFHPSRPLSPPVSSFPVPPSAAQGPSSRPFGSHGQTQPTDGGGPVSNSPENARPQGNRNPSSGSGFQGLPNSNTASPNFGNGSPNFNNVPPNVNTGTPNSNTVSPNVNNGQIIPTSANGRPISNGPSRDSQVLMPSDIPSSPGNILPNISPLLLSETVRFPALESTMVVMPFVQSAHLLTQNVNPRHGL